MEILSSSQYFDYSMKSLKYYSDSLLKFSLPFSSFKFSVDYPLRKIYFLVDRNFIILSFEGELLSSKEMNINPEMYCKIDNTLDFIVIHYYYVSLSSGFRRYDEVLTFEKTSLSENRIFHIDNFFYCSTDTSHSEEENIIYSFFPFERKTKIKKINLNLPREEKSYYLEGNHFFLYEYKNKIYSWCQNNIYSTSLLGEDEREYSILFERVYSFYKGIFSSEIDLFDEKIKKKEKYLIFSFFSEGEGRVFAFSIENKNLILLFSMKERVNHISMKKMILSKNCVDTILIFNSSIFFTLSTKEVVSSPSLLPTGKQLLFPYFKKEGGLVEIIYYNL